MNSMYRSVYMHCICGTLLIVETNTSQETTIPQEIDSALY